MGIIQEIASAERRDRSLCGIAVNRAYSRDVSGAVRIVETIGNDFWRAHALYGVAEAAVASSNTASPMDVIDRLTALTNAIPLELGRLWVLSLIIRMLVRCGRKVKAAQMTRQLSDLVEVGPPGDRAMGLLAVAHALAETGNMARAVETMHRAVADVETHGADGEKALVLDQMTHLLMENGLHELALIVWRARIRRAQFSGRREMLGALEQGVPLIARIDGGQMLWREYEAIMDVEGWRGSAH